MKKDRAFFLTAGVGLILCSVGICVLVIGGAGEGLPYAYRAALSLLSGAVAVLLSVSGWALLERGIRWREYVEYEKETERILTRVQDQLDELEEEIHENSPKKKETARD